VIQPYLVPHALDRLLLSLDSTDRARIETARQVHPFINDVLAQLDRILSSPQFIGLQQTTRDFLVFGVCKTLLGDVDEIKESVIANSVYKEPADFNTAESAKVRVAGSSLRLCRLPEYYALAGLKDPIRICLPPKGYVPDIRDRRSVVMVNGLGDWHPNLDHGPFCDWIASELVDELNQAGWIRATHESLNNSACTPRQFRLQGSVEPSGAIVKLNVSLGEVSSGRILASYNIEGPRERIVGLARDTARQLVDALRAELDGPHALIPPPRPPLRPARASLRTPVHAPKRAGRRTP
jgi:hypothetical protein